jgi:hypothetical protein
LLFFAQVAAPVIASRPRSKSFKCASCPYTARNHYKLVLHRKDQHFGESKYACERCAFQTNSQKEFKAHTRAQHLTSDKKIYSCAHCPEFLCTNRKVLDQHIIDSHKNVRKFHCEECNYSSNYLNNFKRHQMAHQGIPGKFLCPYCTKSFYVEAKMRSHMLVHTDDKNFVCDECAAKFKRKDDLKVHMAIHLPADIRAVEKAKKLTKVCETCGKKFEKNWKLKRHMVVHTKDSSNAFVERAAAPRWHSSKAEIVLPEEQKFIVLNDPKFVTADGKFVTTETKFVCSTDGKFVTTETKFVPDRIVFNQIHYSDV